MSLQRKIAHNTIIQIGGKILSTFLGLLAIGMLTRYLGAERFGWYTTAITFLQFAGILVDFGLIPVTSRMLSEGIFPPAKLFKNLLAYRFVTAFIFFGIAPLVAWFFPYPSEIKIAISLMSISFLAIAMNQVLTGYYQRELAMHIPVLGENIGRIVLVIGLLLGRYFQIGFLPLMMVVAVGSLSYTAVMWIAAARRTPAGFAFDWPIWNAITKTMWPIAISIIFNVIYLKGDTILISLYRSQIEVGWYGAAYRVVDILSQMAMLLMGVMLPLMAESFARKKLAEFKERFQNSFDTMMLFAVPMAMGTFVLARTVMALVAGPDFATSGVMLQTLSIAVFGVYLGAVFGHTAVAIGQQKATMWIYISDAILTFSGYAIFIPIYGWKGAAAFTIFSELYAGILLAVVVQRHTPERLHFGKFGKILAAALCMAGVLTLLAFLPLILLVPLAMLVYIGALFLLGVVSKESVREILRRT